ncbi:hypothetical protein EVAR_18538_1 [Eumeta japonica]|uniref:Uncharacterized protein n=1 Tax=Eumeta variegata TaxID=151549 RepID=A0A4C1V3D9_EUMVA|nr:hypothetical protein EVAR_18538_1 [Eumeta japonica]
MKIVLRHAQNLGSKHIVRCRTPQGLADASPAICDSRLKRDWRVVEARGEKHVACDVNMRKISWSKDGRPLKMAAKYGDVLCMLRLKSLYHSLEPLLEATWEIKVSDLGRKGFEFIDAG